jgi:hypothetical protein
MGNSREQEYPILGLDLKGKAAVHFCSSLGLGEEREADAQRSRGEGTGYLYADTIAALPTPVKVDPQQLKDCPPKE